MRRTLRAVWRGARVLAHMLHGVGIVLGPFRHWPPARRLERVQWWAGKLLAVAGLQAASRGTPASGGVLLVANHVSWLDICAIHAVCPQARFVSKADVRRWPVVSRLADAAHTLYIERSKRRDAMRVQQDMSGALTAGDMVALFPEGTTGEGHALLPFHANLLQSAIASGVPVQPLALRYADALHTVSPAVAYVGDTTLLQSLWWVLRAEGLRVDLDFLPPLESAGSNRRALTEAVRASIDGVLASRSPI